jgi:Asp-tRNA(Asn)/Glu-tRNA(Gln) amidotransferase B subunit
MAPEVAQLKFLASKADTDLEGRAFLSGLAPGEYWISTLNLDADAGDMRVRWDVPVRIERGKTMRVELSNLNSIDARSSTP